MKSNDQKYVLKKVGDAEIVRHEKTGKFYIREAAEGHEMSSCFDTEEEAWADSRKWVDEYL